MSEKYGYARISMEGLIIENQVKALKEAGISEDNIFIDVANSKDLGVEYERLFNKLQEGDTVYISSLNRLGRPYYMKELLQRWVAITEEKKVDIVMLDMPPDLSVSQIKRILELQLTE